MEFVQTREILEKATSFHRRLSEYYKEEGDMLDDRKAKLLLTYLSRHERNLAELLERYAEDARPAIVNTWFKYTPDSLTRLMEADEHIPPGSTMEDVINIAMKMDEMLVSFYEDAADRALSSDVREFFENLMAQEEDEAHRLARGTFGDL